MDNLLEESQYKICKTCNYRMINSNQLCRRRFLPSQIKTRDIQNNSSTISGNLELDEFIKETQQNSKSCDDFVEWIPNSNFKKVRSLVSRGNSEVYCGTWRFSVIP